MCERQRRYVELNLLTACLCLLAWTVLALTCAAQTHEIQESAKAVAGLSATELLALVCILSIALSGYLIRLLFGKMISTLERFTALLAERPCIRDPKNN